MAKKVVATLKGSKEGRSYTKVERLELKKYNPILKRVTVHKEIK